MLDMQIKSNAFGEVTEFIPTEHDAAEFNATVAEIINAIEDNNGIPEPLISYLSNDPFQLSQAIYAGGNIIMEPSLQNGSLAEFTVAGVSGNSLPDLAMMEGNAVRWRATSTNAGGAYSIKWNAATVSLINTDTTALRLGQVRIGAIITAMYDGTNWILINVIDGQTGGQVYGNLAVISAGEEIIDFHANETVIQYGERGILSSDTLSEDINLMYNAYRKAGSANDDFEKIVSDWAGRIHFDSAEGVAAIEMANTGTPDSDFNFTRAWAINRAGDTQLGSSPVVYEPNGDPSWRYQWYNNNYSESYSVGFARVIYGYNCYGGISIPTSTVIISTTGDWFCRVQDGTSGFKMYAGNGTGGVEVVLSNSNQIAEFGNTEINLIKPIGFGSDYNLALDMIPDALQHGWNDTSSQINSSDADLPLDQFNHGFYSTNPASSSYVLLDQDDADTRNRNAIAINQNTGLLIAEGTTVTPNTPTQALIYQSGSDTPNEVEMHDGTGEGLLQAMVWDRTRDRFLSLFSDSGATASILRYSDDQGLTWTQSAETFSAGSGQGSAMFVALDGTLTVAVNIGGANDEGKCFVSTDGGVTFTAGTTTLNLEMAPGSQLGADSFGNALYMGSDLAGDGLFDSTDNGLNWSLIANNTALPLTLGINAVAVDPTNANTIFAWGRLANANAAFFKSTDTGVSWTQKFEYTPTAGTAEDILIALNGDIYISARVNSLTDTYLGISSDNGESFTTFATDIGSASEAMIQDERSQTIYATFSNATLPSVKTIDVQKEISLINGVPIKVRQKLGTMDFMVADEITQAADVVFTGITLSIAKKYLGLLGNSADPADVPPGALFRNSLDGNFLYTKELDSSISRVGGSGGGGTDDVRAFGSFENSAITTVIANVDMFVAVKGDCSSRGTLKDFSLGIASNISTWTYNGADPIDILVEVKCNGRMINPTGNAKIQMAIFKGGVAQTSRSEVTFLDNFEDNEDIDIFDIISITNGENIQVAILNHTDADNMVIQDLQINITQRAV